MVSGRKDKIHRVGRTTLLPNDWMQWDESFRKMGRFFEIVPLQQGIDFSETRRLENSLITKPLEKDLPGEH